MSKLPDKDLDRNHGEEKIDMAENIPAILPNSFLAIKKTKTEATNENKKDGSLTENSFIPKILKHRVCDQTTSGG